MTRAAAFAALALALPDHAYSQATGRRASIQAGVTIERVVSEYRFENASSFDTAALVPHFFVQHYESTQPWFVARARYSVGRGTGETMAGYAPEHLTFGSDVDTFLQPDGDIVTSGTSGDVRMRSFAIDQRIPAGHVHGWPLGVQARYTYRHAEFLPADRVVTHTRPPSEARDFISTREMTTSHEVRIGMSIAAARDVGAGWRLECDGVGWPAVRGRLVTELPDKYPGTDIAFDAAGFGGEGRVAFVRGIGAGTLAFTAHAGITLPYRHAASLRQHMLGAGVTLGLPGR